MYTRPWDPALFTNRAKEIHTFAAYLNGDTPRPTILFLRGDAGIGKSVLLRYLRDQCCKRLPLSDWRSIQAMSNDLFKEAFVQATTSQSVPFVLHNLGASPQGIDRPQEALPALMMLRRALANYGFRFPLFDTAAVKFLTAGRHSKAEIKAYFPSDAHPYVDQAINILTAAGSLWCPPAVLAAPLWSALKDDLGTWLDRYRQRRRLEHGELEEILSLDPLSELIDELPVFFARDLNTGMALDNASPRLVLFFDAHETFWRVDRDLSAGMYFERDDWLRRLLAELDRSSGIVTVVAGQEKPRWSLAPRDVISQQDIDLRTVENLNDSDASLYLDRVGIQDIAIKQRLLEIARVQKDEIHPLFLSLGAQSVLESARSGHSLTVDELPVAPGIMAAGRELIILLLKYTKAEIGFAVRALCACRSFDWDIYQIFAQSLHFIPTKPAFATLIQYHFVWKSESGAADSYRVHDLLRRLMHEHDTDGTVADAHGALERYYKQRVEQTLPTATLDDVVEAIFHANQVDWARGVEEWCSVIDEALQMGQYSVCDALVTLRESLLVETAYSRGRMAQSSGEYYRKGARYREAVNAFQTAIDAMTEALSSPDKAEEEDALTVKAAAMGRLAEIADIQSNYTEANTYSRAALAVYDVLMQRFPTSVEARHNRGVLLTLHGEVIRHLGQPIAAATSFRHAVAVQNGILRLDPEHVEAYNNRGNAL